MTDADQILRETRWERKPEPERVEPVPYAFVHRCPEVSTEGEVCRICRWIRERNRTILG